MPTWRPRNYGDGTAEAIDHAVKALVDQAFDRATAVLTSNRKQLEIAAQQVLARETLAKDDLEAIRNTVTMEPSMPVLKAVPGGRAARERVDPPA